MGFNMESICPTRSQKSAAASLQGTSSYPRSLKKEEDSGRKHVLMLRTGVEDEKHALVSYPVRERVWNEDLNWRNVQRFVGKPYKRSLKKPARTCFCLVFGEKRMEEGSTGGKATQLIQQWKENQRYKGEAENKRWIKNGAKWTKPSKGIYMLKVQFRCSNK